MIPSSYWYRIFPKIITSPASCSISHSVPDLYQKRYKRERRLRARLQQQMENEFKKRSQIEEILKASGAPAEALRILSGNYILDSNKFTWARFHSQSGQESSASRRIIWNLMRCWATFTVILTNFSCFWHLKWFCPAGLGALVEDEK